MSWGFGLEASGEDVYKASSWPQNWWHASHLTSNRTGTMQQTHTPHLQNTHNEHMKSASSPTAGERGRDLFSAYTHTVTHNTHTHTHRPKASSKPPLWSPFRVYGYYSDQLAERPIGAASLKAWSRSHFHLLTPLTDASIQIKQRGNTGGLTISPAEGGAGSLAQGPGLGSGPIRDHIQPLVYHEEGEGGGVTEMSPNHHCVSRISIKQGDYYLVHKSQKRTISGFKFKNT